MLLNMSSLTMKCDCHLLFTFLKTEQLFNSNCNHSMQIQVVAAVVAVAAVAVVGDATAAFGRSSWAT